MTIKVLVVCCCLATVAFADTVELKTGERLEGTFRQASVSSGIVIEVAGQAITIPLAKVRAIYFGAAKPAPSASAPASRAPASWQEALDAVRGLRSVTASGISYRDYASRVLDAKVKVDRYLASLKPDDEKSDASTPANLKALMVRSGIKMAMMYYESASSSWNDWITGGESYQAAIGPIETRLQGDWKIAATQVATAENAAAQRLF